MPQIDGPLDQFYTSRFKTEFGWFRPVSDGKSLIRLDWNQTGWQETDCPDDVSRETKAQLGAFFAGKLQSFTLPLSPIGKSATGRYWLDIMRRIPYGTVMTYTEFASFAGRPMGARAAGSACANNPIPIIYPCHRVIRNNGILGNYGGGSDKQKTHPENLARKSDLLRFEAHHVTCLA